MGMRAAQIHKAGVLELRPPIRIQRPKSSQDASAQQTNAMKISIKIQDNVVTATLMDNATSRDFVSLLPMDLTLEDYAATEKISNLPRRLSTEGTRPQAAILPSETSPTMRLGATWPYFIKIFVIRAG